MRILSKYKQGNYLEDCEIYLQLFVLKYGTFLFLAVLLRSAGRAFSAI